MVGNRVPIRTGYLMGGGRSYEVHELPPWTPSHGAVTLAAAAAGAVSVQDFRAKRGRAGYPILPQLEPDVPQRRDA